MRRGLPLALVVLAGALVLWLLFAAEREGPEDPSAVDASDTATLPCLPDRVRLADIGARTPRHAGLLQENVSLDVPDEDLVLVVQTCAHLAGRIRFEDGTPAAGLTIDVDADGRVWDEGPQDPRTDAEGRFDLPRVPASDVTLDLYTEEPWTELEDHVEVGLKPGEQREGLEIRIPRARTIHGRLLDETGRPLAGEEIAAYRQALDEDGDEDGEWLEWTDTDERGHFRLALGTGAGVLLIHDRADREIVLARDIHAPAGPLELVSARAPAQRIRLRVLGPSGDPVPRFRATARRQQVDWAGDTRRRKVAGVVGREGLAALTLLGPPPWSIEIDGARDGSGMPLPFGTRDTRVAAVPDGPLTIRLLPAGTVDVEVVDPAGRPVTGATLKLDRRGDGRVEAAGPGRFRVVEIPHEKLWVGLWFRVPPGYVRRDWVRARSDEPEQRIVLRAASHVAGRLRSPRPLAPAALAGIRLDAAWDGTLEGESAEARVAVDGEGRFRLEGLPPDAQVRLSIVDELPADLYLEASVLCRAGAEDVVLRLAAGAALTVHVTGRGAGPPEDFTVQLLTAPAGGLPREVARKRLDDEGAARFRALPPGSYDVVVQGEPSSVTLARRRGVQPGGAIRVAVPARATLRGRIGPLPFAGAIHISAWAPGDAEGFAQRPTDAPDATGAFVLEGLARDTAYAIHAFEMLPDGGGRVGLLTNVRPVGGAIEIELAAPESISGRVRGVAPGRTVGRIHVGNAHIAHMAWPDDDGTFELPWLVPGLYDLTLVDEEGHTLAVARGVPSGSHDVVLRIR